MTCLKRGLTVCDLPPQKMSEIKNRSLSSKLMLHLCVSPTVQQSFGGAAVSRDASTDVPPALQQRALQPESSTPAHRHEPEDRWEHTHTHTRAYISLLRDRKDRSLHTHSQPSLLLLNSCRHTELHTFKRPLIDMYTHTSKHRHTPDSCWIVPEVLVHTHTHTQRRICAVDTSFITSTQMHHAHTSGVSFYTQECRITNVI